MFCRTLVICVYGYVRLLTFTTSRSIRRPLPPGACNDNAPTKRTRDSLDRRVRRASRRQRLWSHVGRPPIPRSVRSRDLGVSSKRRFGWRERAGSPTHFRTGYSPPGEPIVVGVDGMPNEKQDGEKRIEGKYPLSFVTRFKSGTRSAADGRFTGT